LAQLSLPDFIAALPASGALLGVDPGKKRVGVAVCDPARRVAAPLDTIAREKFTADAARLFALYDSRACVGLVIGLPLNMDGTAGPSAQAANAFARNLLMLRDIPIFMQDERLSTAAVTRGLIELDTSRADRARLVDKAAAAYLLQTALDRMIEKGDGQ
jgi:putative Holliday junction resolvase